MSSNKIHSKQSLYRLQKSVFKIILAPSHDDIGTPRYIVLCKKLKTISSEFQFLFPNILPSALMQQDLGATAN